MKNKSIISLLILLAGFGVFTSCSDMLSPDLERYSETSAKDSLYSYLGILNGVQKIAERNVILGDCRSDLVATSKYTSDSISSIVNFENPADGSNVLLHAADYYYLINQCNAYLGYADTAAVKNNVYYMRAEYAQVEAVRGWAYLQLVQTYGSVPFITQFVQDAQLSEQLMQSATKINKDNIYDLLMTSGNLSEAYTWQQVYGLPNYGTFSTGSGADVASTMCMIPIELVIADAALTQNRYEMACTYYRTYFEKERTYYPANLTYRCQSSMMVSNNVTTYSAQAKAWGNMFNEYASGELLTVSPGAGNSTFGKTFTLPQNLYGFKTSSTSATSTQTKTDGTTEVVTSGSFTVTANEKYRQLAPSANYLGLNAEQPFNLFAESAGGDISIKNLTLGDVRLYASAPQVEIDGVKYRFVDKFCNAQNYVTNTSHSQTVKDFQMHYAIPLYREAQVWLRYAEALNRAGYPRYAFAILKDGLCAQTVPYAFVDSIKTWKFNYAEDGVTKVDSTLLVTAKDTLTPPAAGSGGAYYITFDEAYRAQHSNLSLNFQTYSDLWGYYKDGTTDGAYRYGGIHSRGCGETAGTHDTIYTFDKVVAAKIAENVARKQALSASQSKALAKRLELRSLTGVSEADIMNAVEDAIIDECALETAFEGYRMPDLIRVASHKTLAGEDGTSWLAWKIARRDVAPSAAASEYNTSLYGKLLSTANWYLPFPKK